MELPTQANLNEIWRNLSQDKNLNELWRVLGRSAQRTPDHEWLGRISLFGAGLMVGAGLALLLTVRDEDTHDGTDEDTIDEAAGAGEDLH